MSKLPRRGCFLLFCIGDVHAGIEYVEIQVRGKVSVSCHSREVKCGASSVKLCSIPTHSEAFTEYVHILLCHIQVAIWKAALIESPPEMDSIKYGWELDQPVSWFRGQYILVHCLHRQTYYNLLTATARHLGVALQHVASRKLGAQYSVCVTVPEACKNPLMHSQTEDESENTIDDPDEDDM